MSDFTWTTGKEQSRGSIRWFWENLDRQKAWETPEEESETSQNQGERKKAKTQRG